MKTRHVSRRLAQIVTLVAVITVQACSSNLQTGGLGGAAAGAVAGAVASGTAKGVIVGAVIGGAAGAAIGAIMDRQAVDLQDKLPEAAVERVGEGIQVTFDSGILFDVDSSELRSTAQGNLRRLAESLEDYEGTSVLVVGHTDSTGESSYNHTLSERRAGAARTFLMGAGLKADRVNATGKGEDEPVADNATEAGRQANRRVEIAIYADEAMRQDMLRRHGG
jgi:outer membrane protein OmpA-like peptidoglycan-associated protein